MTADIRTAAQREAEQRELSLPKQASFVEGAVWGAARPTLAAADAHLPSVDEIQEVIDCAEEAWEHLRDTGRKPGGRVGYIACAVVKAIGGEVR